MTFPIIFADHGARHLGSDLYLFFQIYIGVAAVILQTDDAFCIVFQIQGDGLIADADYGAFEDISLMNLLKGSLQLIGVIGHGFCGLSLRRLCGFCFCRGCLVSICVCSFFHDSFCYFFFQFF